jgi:hypothetical protein
MERSRTILDGADSQKKPGVKSHRSSLLGQYPADVLELRNARAQCAQEGDAWWVMSEAGRNKKEGL